MLAEGITEYFAEQIGFSYAAPFLVLLLCGLGAPFPEEVPLIGAGILLYKGEVAFFPVVLICSAAILLGDSLWFHLGRRFGMRALRVRWVRKVLHPERFAKLEKRFKEHGNLATFAFRFAPGVRIPGYFLAGTLGMKWGRFLILNGLGIVLSVPISIYLGKLFGGHFDRLQANYRNLHLVLAFAVLVLVVVIVLRTRSRKAAIQAASDGGGDRDVGS